LLTTIFSNTSKGLAVLAVLVIRGYQIAISPLFPANCRFHPSCSRYSIGALKKHGIVKGGVLSVWRVLRCNPFNAGGYDPIP
jgi:hypothetical protein